MSGVTTLKADQGLACGHIIQAGQAPTRAETGSAVLSTSATVNTTSMKSRVAWPALRRTPSPRLAHATAGVFLLSAILASIADLFGGL